LRYCNNEKIHIGKISGASGLKGEIKLFHYSGESERIAGIGELFLQLNADMRRVEVESLRIQGRTPILKFVGIDDRNAAESLIGAEVFAASESLAPLEDGQFYVTELVGLSVEDERMGYLGDVAEVIDNPAHDILRISGANGEWLLPMIDVFILNIDTEHRRISVRVPEGLTGSGRGS
jgi:16S rRNA processing protein RimM